MLLRAVTLTLVFGLSGCDGGEASDAGPTGGGDAAVELPEGCESGPLDAPRPDCRPAPLPSTGDLAQDCVNRVNQLRAECQCLPPLARWEDGEDCADEHAEHDADRMDPHAGFRDRICTPGGGGQNECPGYPNEGSIVATCLQQMWDEGPGEDFQRHGHYLNMTSSRFGRVACGFHTTDDGAIWAVQNFGP